MTDYFLSMLIDGEWTQGSSGIVQPVLNPATGETLGQLPHASSADLDRALASSQRGFDTWRNTPADQRQQIMSRAERTIEARAEEIAATLTREEGKPIAEARMEIQSCIGVLRWFGEEGKRVYGRTVPARVPGTRQIVLKEPVGPVAAFAAWNFPGINVMRKIAAALGAGCSIIIKPSEETPATCLAFARALQEAGLPPGVLNVVFGIPDDVSRHLLTSPIPRKLSFTGSVAVGQRLQVLATATMKRCTMELGGHAPVIVFDDADVEAVAAAIVPFKFRNAGQVCSSPTRFYVQRGIAARFEAAVVAATARLRTGDGLDPATTVGPLIDARRLPIVQAFVDDAVASGARLLAGGRAVAGPGFFYEPTVLADVPTQARVMNEEPFGPLIAMAPFDEVDDAIEQANRLDFGLASYVFTRSGGRAAAVEDRINAGVVGVNNFMIAMPETPFGGVNLSGYGSEGGAEGIEAYLRTKFVSEHWN